MRHKLLAAALTTLLAAPLAAQAPPDTTRQDPTFALWTASLTLATVYDIETTVRGLSRCACREGGPLTRIVIGRRANAYLLSAALNTAVATLSWKAKKDGKPWWWVPMGILSAVHIGAGTLNLRLTW